jgi:hypothetical protein
VVISELPDSFIIVLPHALQPEGDGSWSLSPNSASPLFRLFKSVVCGYAMPEVPVLLSYLMVVKDNTDRLPGFFNKDRKAQIDSLILQINEVRETEPELSGKRLGGTDKSFTPPSYLHTRTKH